MTADHPNERQWPFTGGSLRRVLVDVSGDASMNLGLEASNVMKRDRLVRP